MIPPTLSQTSPSVVSSHAPTIRSQESLRTFRAMVLSSSRAWCIEGFEFLVQLFELLLEVLVADRFAWRDANVAARIQTPGLLRNLCYGRNAT